MPSGRSTTQSCRSKGALYLRGACFSFMDNDGQQQQHGPPTSPAGTQNEEEKRQATPACLLAYPMHQRRRALGDMSCGRPMNFFRRGRCPSLRVYMY